MPIAIGIFAFFSFFLFTTPVNAHSDTTQTIGKYSVAFTQEPLSPLVGENVKISLVVEDENGQPLENVKGDIVIKQFIVTENLGKDPETKIEEIYKVRANTDPSGTLSTEYTFKKEGLYDVEFIWGNAKNESAGKMLQIREPTSYFMMQELQKRLWLFMGIALAGVAIGAIGTFILMTTTLHPEK